jgi:PAS domain-containing protein
MTQDHSLANLAPDSSLEPRLRALLAELPASQAAVLEDLWRERERLTSLAEQHRLVLQTSTDAILIAGVGGLVEYANEAASQLFSAKRTLRGVRIEDLVSHAEHDALKEHVRHALMGDAVRGQFCVLRPR